MKTATMIRRASELDVGSRIVVGSALRTVVRVHDLPGNTMGAFVTLVLDNGCAIVERARTLYRCA
jgi:hypothetical protein